MDFSRKFVAATREYSTYQKHVPAPYIRKSFFLDKKIKSAEILICGLGFYDLYINGKKITKGYIAPYISNTDDIIYYDRYDLAKYLKTGENVIGIILGNGMQNSVGGMIWDFDGALFRSAPKVALSFEAVFTDGESLKFEADESFKCAPSPVRYDDLRNGTFYDARCEQEGWCDIGFDDSSWKNVFFAEMPRGKAKICTAEPIVKTKEQKPVKISKGSLSSYLPRDDTKDTITEYHPEETEGYLYDFGFNAAGVPCLKIKGKRGQKIVLQTGEILDSEGRLTYQNLRFFPDGYVQRDIYICKGEDEEVFVPPFTYHGFRYCLVMGIEEHQATDELLTYYVLNSDIKERGNFTCSDEIATKLQEITRRSDLANFFYFPTDCPHREKNGWTGDASMSAEQMILNLTVENSYKEWLNNIRAAQREDGALPGIVPTAGWGFAWGNGPAWDSVLANLLYYVYLYRGDTDIIKENATALIRYIDYISKRRNGNGLVAIGLGDWIHVGRSSPENYKSPLVVTDSIITYDICEKAAFLFDVIGLSAQRGFAMEIASEMRKAIRERLVDFTSMTVAGACQTSQAMALYYGIFDIGERQAAFLRLMDFVKEHDEHFDVGFLGLRVLFHVLSDFGETELAYKMITRTDYPSYGMLIKRGATTLWESFPEKGLADNSNNHHFFGDISAWFIKTVAGIRVNPYRKNAKEVDIKPSFIEKLSSAEGFHDTVAGRVSVRWERSGKTITLEITKPEEAFGHIILPKGYVFDENCPASIADTSYITLSSGKYTIRKK